MSKRIAYTVVLSLGGIATLPGCEQAKQSTPEALDSVSATATTPVSLPTLTLVVSGMSWQFGCKPRVEAALQKTPGVDQVTVDFGKKEATVQLKPSATDFDSKTLVEALKGAGFDGKIVE